jgi:hypothetical protein
MSSTLQNVSRSVRENDEMKKIYNWNEISKLELPDQFIDELFDCLNWDVMSKHQRFSLSTMEKFEYLINYGFLVLNKNNSPEVLSAYIDKMDWETAQKEQSLTLELLERFRDSLDTLVILQHQKLPEDFILSLLNVYIKEKNWDLVRKYLTIIFTYQKVSTNFVMQFLLMETQINEDADATAVIGAADDPKPEIILVDLPAVVRSQDLTPDFLKTFCMEFTEVRREICKSQKLAPGFIAENFEKLNTRRLLKYQQMDTPTLVRICEQFIYLPVVTDAMVQALTGATPAAGIAPIESDKAADRRFIMANALVNNQVYNMEMFNDIVNAFPDHPRWQEVLWGNVFLRTLNPIGNEKYLGIGADTVLQEILPKVNWDMVAECNLEPVQIETLVATVPDRIPWFIFVKKHLLNEAQITKLDEGNYLTHMTWWTILNGNTERDEEKKLSTMFMRKNTPKLLWIPQVTDPGTFYQAWLKAKDNLDNVDTDTDVVNPHLLAEIREFIPAYVKQADWRRILREVQLPEWAMRVFGEYSDKIEMYWWKISRWQKLPPAMVNRHIDKLDLQIVLGYQDVSEEFLREKSPFFSEENWDAVARHQKMTTQFLEDFAENLPIDELAKNPHV